VGNAVFIGERENGGRLAVYSKYLTVWKKQRDGNWRYVVDGGNSRPQ
jgi:ketosteroid isomerase-like protein